MAVTKDRKRRATARLLNSDQMQRALIRLGQDPNLEHERMAILQFIEDVRESAESAATLPAAAANHGTLAHAAGAVHQMRVLRETLLAIFAMSLPSASNRSRPPYVPED